MRTQLFSKRYYLYTFDAQPPPFIPPQAGGRVGGIIGVENPSHSVQIICNVYHKYKALLDIIYEKIQFEFRT